MSKISDYKFCTSILKIACKAAKCSFVDMVVYFDDTGFIGLKDNAIYIGLPINLSATFANVIFVYLDNFKQIHGKEIFNSSEQKNTTCLLIANFIRKLSDAEDGVVESFPNEPVAQRLYQNRFVWILMQDLICPAYLVPLKNHRVICCPSPSLDISGCFEEKCDYSDELSVFVNTDVEYKPCLYAGLLLSSIECHGLEPHVVVQEIIESNLYDLLVGVAKLAFDSDQSVNDFLSFLVTFAGLENKLESIVENAPDILSGDSVIMYKNAQHASNYFTDSSWWYFGLLEKMLESVRGSDWTTYKNLMPHLRETWDQIHEARRKKGRDGLSYEALLRVKSKEDDKDPRILEVLLGNNRVW